MFIVNDRSERHYGRPHCERRDGRPHYYPVSAVMAGLTVSAAMAVLANILWAPMADRNVISAMAGLTNILWAPMADLMNILSPSPNPLFRLCRPTSFMTSLSNAPSFLLVLVGGVGGGWCLNHGPLTHRRLRRCSYLYLHHVLHRILLRSCYAVPPSSNFCNFRPCPSVPRGIPDLRRHHISSCGIGSFPIWPP